MLAAVALLVLLSSFQQPCLAVSEHVGQHQQLHHTGKCSDLNGLDAEQCAATEHYQLPSAGGVGEQSSGQETTDTVSRQAVNMLPQLLKQQQQISALQDALASLHMRVQQLCAEVAAQAKSLEAMTATQQLGRASEPDPGYRQHSVDSNHLQHTSAPQAAGRRSAASQPAAEEHGLEATDVSSQHTSKWARASAWLDHFLLLSVLKPMSVDSSSRWTSAAPLYVDLTHPASEKAPRYIAMGSRDGSVNVYSTRGGLVAQVDTGSTAAVTALGSFPLRRNESVLVTGHADGEVRMHSLAHASPAAGPKGGFTRVALKHVLPAGLARDGIQIVPSDQATPITHIQPLRSSPRTTARRQVAVWDASGWMRMQRENGSVRLAARANSTILATTQSGALLVGLTSTHAVVHKQQLSSGFRGVPCRGLNGTHMLAAAFDPARPFRAYAINDAQQLLMLMVPHEGKPSTCKVVRAHPVALLSALTAVWAPQLATSQPNPSPTSNSNGGVGTGNGPSQDQSTGVGSPAVEAGGPEGWQGTSGTIAMAALRGYLVVSHAGGAALLNVSAIRMPSTPVLAEPWEQLNGMLGIPEAGADQPSMAPLLAASAAGAGMVLLGLPGEQGVVVLESDLPVPQNLQQTQEQGGKGIWSQPVFLGIMILVGVWQFTRARGRMNHYGIGMNPMGGPRAAGSMGMNAGMGSRLGAGGRPGSAVAYEAALARLQRERQQRKRGGAARMGGRPLATQMEDDDEDDEDEMMTSEARQQQAQHQAFGGFPGPRSVQRAMRMGVTPIIENHHEGLDADHVDAEHIDADHTDAGHIDDDEDNRR